MNHSCSTKHSLKLTAKTPEKKNTDKEPPPFGKPCLVFQASNFRDFSTPPVIKSEPLYQALPSDPFGGFVRDLFRDLLWPPFGWSIQVTWKKLVKRKLGFVESLEKTHLKNSKNKKNIKKNWRHVSQGNFWVPKVLLTLTTWQFFVAFLERLRDPFKGCWWPLTKE